MEKRHRRSTMLFSLLFLLMLVIAVGSFIFGVKIGVNKTEDRYKSDQEAAAVLKTAAPASQQDLVSFYNTVFLPYSEFQTKWLESERALSQGKLTKSESAFTKLAKLAKQQYVEAGTVNMQNIQLLGSAQTSYLRSLKLFGQAAEEAAAHAKKLKNADLSASIAADVNYKTAIKQQLAAQQLFYDGMLQWNASVDSSIPAHYSYNPNMKLAAWNKLPLIVKNKLMADQLKSVNALTEFYPQDLASRIDALVKGGQAAKLKLVTLSDAIHLLSDTNAVRSGDYDSSKTKLYAGEQLPVPFS
ncbi:hypothetical protein [Paenibacillus protaetiae]|uniref:Uncharacterized protein n=1 Tax=Paenibacillus protaetiae TaxID=2509456 RepID=A0A4V0YF21_9BACL|nr:hypothetical protein [Paenibacillus protaetiae]QAY66191.1 hypothetical protein ET464_07055 [Paenibacillus protaetiae]